MHVKTCYKNLLGNQLKEKFLQYSLHVGTGLSVSMETRQETSSSMSASGNLHVSLHSLRHCMKFYNRQCKIDDEKVNDQLKIDDVYF